jgi:UDP-N-acetylglucosamine 1-carboxyvinyltransferase
MTQLIVEGGYRLEGEYRVAGNKNEALPILAATLLTHEPVVLHNLPDICDVRVTLEILEAIGCEVKREGDADWRIDASGVESGLVPAELGRRIRASILMVGPLLSRVGRVELPPPGGDVIGRRRLDTHFDAFKAMGTRVEIGRTYFLETTGLQGTELFLDEQSVTATENIVMAAVLAKGTTTIMNAALEPHVQGLCRFLNGLGARVEGIGTNFLTIHGVSELGGGEFTIGGDYLEAGSIIGLAATTNSEITVSGVDTRDMRVILSTFGRLGVKTFTRGDDIFVPANQELVVRADYHGAIPKIDDAPWPQFPTDLMSIAIVIATQASGTILFFEKMYEGRMFFVDTLISMGARIIMCDPHRVVVVGPSELYGTRMESPDIRAGMALLIAGLTARGKSVIANARQIDRGYERIDEKLARIGARIERVEG